MIDGEATVDQERQLRLGPRRGRVGGLHPDVRGTTDSLATVLLQPVR